MAAIHVGVDNFVRAETDRMFTSLAQEAGGVNRFHHSRVPTPLDHQPVIRMNRDTLYSMAIVDISGGATVTVPDAGDRYLSVMVVNQDHYINRIVHQPGEFTLTTDEFDTPYVLVAVRLFVDPADTDDVAAVATLQDQFSVTAASARPFEATDYDQASLDATRGPLLELLKGVGGGFAGTFGTRDEVDPVRHLIGTAGGWGGLPQSEAIYVGGPADLPVGEYALTVRDVPVDGFWSISVYNAEGYFVPNDRDAVSVNNVTATPDPDGAITVHFGGCSDDRANCLPIMDGWNYVVRLYRPHPEIVSGDWTFPEAKPLN